MPALTHTQATKWSTRLALDIALQLSDSDAFDLGEILAFHKLTEPELVKIAADPLFQRQVQQFRDEIRDKGLGFRTKCKIMADEVLKTTWSLVHDQDTSPAVRADLIKSLVRWADLEPKDKAGIGGDVGGVKITINLGPREESRVIEGG
jgi:hypothetical protein